MRARGAEAFVIALVVAGCAHKAADVPPPPPANEPPPVQMPPPPPRAAPPMQPLPRPPRAEMRELFPGVRADVATKVVEFDGTVPIDCHDPASPDVFLEVTVCTPDTREHESLVMTRVKPSHVHAALLAIGLKPGKPGSWRLEGKSLVAVPPEGDPVELTIAYEDRPGHTVEMGASEWVKTAATGGPFTPMHGGSGWVFAGSEFRKRQGEEVYEADGAGTLIGLTTFGSETIAWADTLSPESGVQDPDWIADPAKVPAAGTRVVVRIKPAQTATVP